MSVLALYRGNSALGQLHDSSGAGRDLTLVGTVANPSTPTVPEGDLWLMGSPVASTDYLKTPTSAPIFGGTQGCLAFYGNVSALTLASRFFTFKYDDATFAGTVPYIARDAVNRLTIRYRRNTSPNETQNLLTSAAAPFTAGVNHIVRMQWSASGVEIYIDGVLVASSSVVMHTGAPTEIRIGSDNFSASQSANNQGFVDAVMFSDDPNEVFPPAPDPEPVESTPTAINLPLGGIALQNNGTVGSESLGTGNMLYSPNYISPDKFIDDIKR